MTRVNTADLISVSDASKLGISGLVRDAEHGRQRVLLRNNKAVAAIVSMERMERLEELEQLEQDLRDISLLVARMASDNGNRHSLDEVLEKFGYTREELRAMPD